MFAHRFSWDPEQQWRFLQMWNDGKLSRGMEVGLDLGCQKMRNYPVFRTKRYVGVDYVEDSLRRGCVERPHAQSVLARIEDYDKYPSADFLLCVQVFQLTDQFAVDSTLPILQGIVNKTNKGGMLIVNFGPANMPYLSGIRDVLQSSFKQVDEMDPPRSVLPGTLLSPIIAANYRPPEVLGQGPKKYFRCLQRA
jgi:hypothetical protein